MKQLFYLLMTALLPCMGWAQEIDPDYWGDPSDHDTTGHVLVLDAVGNPFSGYNLKWENPSNWSISKNRVKCYQCDRDTVPVRQVVVLNEKWPNAPADILEGGGGHKIVAVTPREYEYLKANDMIWGEAFERVKYMGPDDDRYPLIEMTVAPIWAPQIVAWQNRLEIMTYTVVAGGVSRDFFTTAKNIRKCIPDYTASRTGGKYDCSMIAVSGEEERSWIEKSLGGR